MQLRVCVDQQHSWRSSCMRNQLTKMATQQQQHQQYMMQQQQQYYLMTSTGVPWLHPQPTTASMLVVEPAPYGRALSALRHQHEAAIISYFESQGLSVDCSTPTAANVAEVFKQLCEMRASNKLPPEAAWFEHDVTYFEDEHQTSFKNYVRKLSARCRGSSE
jgi:hypothetical protein